jgi:hypothetical protein
MSGNVKHVQYCASILYHIHCGHSGLEAKNLELMSLHISYSPMQTYLNFTVYGKTSRSKRKCVVCFEFSGW